MLQAPAHLWRLARAGYVLARYDAIVTPDRLGEMPWPLRVLVRLARIGRREDGGLPKALEKLGPSYIKLGQFLATRPDLVGMKQAISLQALQDRLPAFGLEQARLAIRAELGKTVEQHYAEFGPPVAAASIAQVHRARTPEGHAVAVKVLRPGVARRLAKDLASFAFAARMAERFSVQARRLRPVAAVATLAQSVVLEMDLRMEASALSEMAANTRDDPGFFVPKPDWNRTAKSVLTLDWVEGTPLSDPAALTARGHNLPAIAATLVQSFLRHAIRDGFFHADMHQGNLFVTADGRIAAIDLGIMGRIGPKEQRFLAEILYGFITRNYRRVADVHFEAGYVPAHRHPADFAQALRAIGEPIMDLKAEDISMARLLTQLFEVTGQFDMVMQPQLILLQKTMVVVEGVARSLDPRFNMWKTAEPVVRQWMERKLGPMGKLEEAAEIFTGLAALLPRLPEALNERPAPAAPAHASNRYALWIGALALAVIAVKALVG